VSSWVWLYFTLTIVLTVIVLCGWWYFAKHENASVSPDDGFQFDAWHKNMNEKTGESAAKDKGQRQDSVIMQPYLAGSIAGLHGLMSGGTREDYFQRELDVVGISPKNTFKGSW
jgi:hypothetical protein